MKAAAIVGALSLWLAGSASAQVVVHRVDSFRSGALSILPVPGLVSGCPLSGSYEAGVLAFAADGALCYALTAGSPPTWSRVALGSELQTVSSGVATVASALGLHESATNPHQTAVCDLVGVSCAPAPADGECLVYDADAAAWSPGACGSVASSTDFLAFNELGEFPPSGEDARLYLALDLNRLYRFVAGTGPALPEPPLEPTLTPTITVTDSAGLVGAIAAAAPGDVIQLANGTYSFSSALSVDKALTLVGESQSGVLVTDSRGNAQTFVSVSADNVTLKNMTIRHVTSDTAIGIAVVVSGGGSPQVRLDNFRMYDCRVEYSKGGLSVRSDRFVVARNTFVVAGGSSTRRGILHYGNGGDSFIVDNEWDNASVTTVRGVQITSTSGSNPSDDLEGSLRIANSTMVANGLQQFLNMDNHQGAAGAFTLALAGNSPNETNAFAVSFGAANNFGDVFDSIYLLDNVATNVHTPGGGGKGLLAVDATGGPRPWRTTPITVYSSGNVLSSLSFISGWAEATGSSGSIVGYRTAQVVQPDVSLADAGSPATYLEVSPSEGGGLPALVDNGVWIGNASSEPIATVVSAGELVCRPDEGVTGSCSPSVVRGLLGVAANADNTAALATEANQIIRTTGADTLAATTINEGELVGRLVDGTLTGLTAAQVVELLDIGGGGSGGGGGGGGGALGRQCLIPRSFADAGNVDIYPPQYDFVDAETYTTVSGKSAAQSVEIVQCYCLPAGAGWQTADAAGARYKLTSSGGSNGVQLRVRGTDGVTCYTSASGTSTTVAGIVASAADLSACVLGAGGQVCVSALVTVDDAQDASIGLLSVAWQ